MSSSKSADFAVGAPYEGNFGAVYVYFGRRDNQALEFLKVPGNFRNDSQKLMQGFGQSVVGEVDLDGNTSPGESPKSRFMFWT